MSLDALEMKDILCKLFLSCGNQISCKYFLDHIKLFTVQFTMQSGQLQNP